MQIRTLAVALSLLGVMTAPVLAQKSGDKTAPQPTAKSAKKMPARDPKTGKFVKSDKAKADGTKSAKKMPARDPKTGKFVKKDGGKK